MQAALTRLLDLNGCHKDLKLQHIRFHQRPLLAGGARCLNVLVVVPLHSQGEGSPTLIRSPRTTGKAVACARREESQALECLGRNLAEASSIWPA